MKILVLGSAGQLGRCICDQFKDSTYEIIFATRDDIDLSDTISIREKILTLNPQIVINAAAYTEVDKAENNQKEADLINFLAVSILAKACDEIDSWLIHLSTDYIFDGLSKVPYKETIKPNPQSIYGISKLKGELAIKNIDSKYIILRTAWVFSEYGDNFFKKMIDLGKENQELSIIQDQLGCPTYAQDIATAIICLVSKIAKNNSESGVFHFCGDNSCSWYEFAKVIFKEAKSLGFEVPNKINPIQSFEYPSLVNRPKYSVLDCVKISNTYKINTSNWREGIKSALINIKDSND